MNHDLVMTGLGALGSFGGSASLLWEALLAARPLIKPCDRLADQALAATVDGFCLDDYKRTAKGQRAPLISQYALAAAAQAIAQARLTDRLVDKDGVAIVYGTGNGPNEVVDRNLGAITRHGLDAVEPLTFQESVFNAPASFISIEYVLRGPLLALPMGWAAGGYALAAAADLIQFGHAPAAVVVVSDELSDIGHAAMKALRLISPVTDIHHAIRPFDPAHTGVICGEGAAAVILETREHAARRDARPLLELAAWSTTSDRFGVGPKSDGRGLAQAMRQATAQAGEVPDVIYAGSYCTADADRAEASAITEVFGRQGAPKVTNLRGAIGEAKAPSGLFNILAAHATLTTGTIPPSTGCRQVAPDCTIDVCTEAQTLPRLNSVMCNAFWVNGTNSAIVVRLPR